MNINILTTPATQIQDIWKEELLNRQETQNNEQYSPSYSFDLEFGNIPIPHISIINDVTPKALIKKDKQIVLRSVSKHSAPSLFYYSLLNVMNSTPGLSDYLTKNAPHTVGLIGDELLSTQRVLQTINVDAELREYKLNAEPTTDEKFNIVIDTNHASIKSSKIITHNVLNTHNTRVIISLLTQNSQLKDGGVFIARLNPKSEVSKALATILNDYFSSVDLIYAFNAELFIVCIGFDANKTMPKFKYTQTPNTYITQIDGVAVDNNICKIIDTAPNTFTPTLNTKKEIITDLKEKINNSIEFLTKYKIDISIYYQPDQILSELQYFTNKK